MATRVLLIVDRKVGRARIVIITTGLTVLKAKSAITTGLTALKVKSAITTGLTVLKVKSAITTGLTVLKEKNAITTGLTVLKEKEKNAITTGLTVLKTARRTVNKLPLLLDQALRIHPLTPCLRRHCRRYILGTVLSMLESLFSPHCKEAGEREGVISLLPRLFSEVGRGEAECRC